MISTSSSITHEKWEKNIPLLNVHTAPATQTVHPSYPLPPHFPHFSTVQPPEEAEVVDATALVVVFRVVATAVVMLVVVERDVTTAVVLLVVVCAEVVTTIGVVDLVVVVVVVEASVVVVEVSIVLEKGGDVSFALKI